MAIQPHDRQRAKAKMNKSKRYNPESRREEERRLERSDRIEEWRRHLVHLRSYF